MRYIIIFILYLYCHAVTAAGEITVHDAWIKEAPPGAKVMAAYMTINNDSGREISLTGADSSKFGKIEFHITRVNDGIASMHRQDSINIAANSSFSFSPGGYHFMLFNPVSSLQSGDVIPLTLTFSDGRTLDVDTRVRRDDSGHSH